MFKGCEETKTPTVIAKACKTVKVPSSNISELDYIITQWPSSGFGIN
jgi:hypothetical protein